MNRLKTNQLNKLLLNYSYRNALDGLRGLLRSTLMISSVPVSPLHQVVHTGAVK